MGKWAFNNQPRCQQCKRFIPKATEAEKKIDRVVLSVITPFIDNALDEDYTADIVFDATENEAEYYAVYARIKAIIEDLKEATS